MAVGHVGYNATNQHGGMLKNALAKMETGLDELNEIHGTMGQMIDGDGSLAAHFTYMTVKFGFTDDATSKAAFDELSSALAKLNTDASVTNVKAAVAQLFNKFR